jgi:hypothetical protein
MMKRTCLDLFCGAGGAAVGYRRAGFEVVGVDIKPQPHYPFEFHQGDALEYLDEHGKEFDFIHASPPCQAFSSASIIHRNRGKKYDDWIKPTRELLIKIAKPFVIENVVHAPLHNPIVLCGTMFGLGVFRHRLFESSHFLFEPEHHPHNGKIGDLKYFSVAGGSGRWKTWGTVHRDVSKGTVRQWREAMGIDWMTGKEIVQAIPPAYTEFIGKQIK